MEEVNNILMEHSRRGTQKADAGIVSKDKSHRAEPLAVQLDT